MNCGGGSSVRINPIGIIFMLVVFVIIVYFNLGSNDSRASLLNDRVTTEAVSLKALLAVSIEMARRGGVEVKRIREQSNIGEKSKGKTKEGANDPVSDGDMLSHRQMYYGLQKAFPLVNIISEESDPEEIDMSKIAEASISNDEVDRIIPDSEDIILPAKDLDIWIDPLDATQEYTESLLNYVTTMVCVAVKGRAVLGIIHKPFNHTTAWAWSGANLSGGGKNYFSEAVKKEVELLQNKEGSDINKHKDVSKSRIIVSRSHAGKVHDVAADVFGTEVTVTPAGGAGFKAWEVAAGRQDAYVHTTLIKKWDICAGTALLRSLGGKMTTLDGSEIDYSGTPAKVKNEGGILATLHDHDLYVDKLKHIIATKR